MKTITKLAVATLLALSTAAPAFADEQDTLAERNTYLSARESRPVAQHTQRVVRHAVRGTDAYASEPAPAATPNDFGILSQH